MFQDTEEVTAAIAESGGGVLGEACQRMAGRILDHRKVTHIKPFRNCKIYQALLVTHYLQPFSTCYALGRLLQL